MTIEEARALVADAALWPRVRDFLWDFAPQIHPSWIDASPHASRFMSSPRVKRFILEELDVEPCFHAFPKDDWSRLLLLDGVMLEAIAKWIGALVLIDQLRLVTDGKAVRELKESFPGIYPDVFAYIMYFSGLDLLRKDGSRGGVEEQRDVACIGEAVVHEGVSALLNAISDLPAPLVARFKLKLPKGLCDSATLRGTKGSLTHVKDALAKLLKLKFPEAYKLCC